MTIEHATDLPAAELEVMESVHPYQEWQLQEGLPRISGFYVEDLAAVQLAEWPSRGASGAFVNLEGTGGVNDLQILELPPGAASAPIRHLFEALVYVVTGRGSATVWYDEHQRSTFEFGTGSVFSIPLNASYRFFNTSGTQPVRLVMVTNAPLIMNLFHHSAFIFDNPFVFQDRFGGEAKYFSGDGKLYRRDRNHIWETNFVPDVRTLHLYDWKARGAGGRNVLMELAHNSMSAHVSEFPVGTYKKAHRHGPGAHVIILNGKGFSTLWRAGGDVTRCDWKPNSVVVPPADWFHQHFNTGDRPARYLALKFSGRRYYISPEFAPGKSDVDVNLGGRQIEYQDEDSAIHTTFEAELAANGGRCGMQGMIAACTASS
jgi:oxalate decarboxylase/phosphoglucose isomerase-like protein (cupin superfamily)